MQALYTMGGIYLDVNAYIVNALDSLMNYSFVIGEEEPGSYGTCCTNLFTSEGNTRMHYDILI